MTWGGKSLCILYVPIRPICENVKMCLRFRYHWLNVLRVLNNFHAVWLTVILYINITYTMAFSLCHIHAVFPTYCQCYCGRDQCWYLGHKYMKVWETLTCTLLRLFIYFNVIHKGYKTPTISLTDHLSIIVICLNQKIRAHLTIKQGISDCLYVHWISRKPFIRSTSDLGGGWGPKYMQCPVEQHCTSAGVRRPGSS